MSVRTNAGEPVLSIASITAVVSTAVGLLVSLGLPISTETKVALLAFVTAAAPLVAAYFQRKRVTPNDAVVVALDAKKDTVAATASVLPNGTEVDVLAV